MVLHSPASFPFILLSVPYTYVIIYIFKKKSKSPESTALWLFLLHVSSLALSFGICLNFYQSFKAYSSLLLFRHLLQSMKNASTFVCITSNDYKSLKCIKTWIVSKLCYGNDQLQNLSDNKQKNFPSHSATCPPWVIFEDSFQQSFWDPG